MLEYRVIKPSKKPAAKVNGKVLIKILIPVYNDWKSVSKLLDEINNLSTSSEFQISVIIVNDASNHDRQDEEKKLQTLKFF